ncbi:recombinase family protein [Neoroseomonas nitratireducens]|uniref:recombinase family protein n=1 Tax=Roseomonas nitratireducens TaxID=2820810 RepID=UPI003158ECC3
MNRREASIEDHLHICRARAEREGWSILGEFSDADMSSTKGKRPGFIALRDAAQAGNCDVILAESLDRFSRDLEDIAAFYKQVTFCRVKLVTLAEGEISDLHVGVKGAMADPPIPNSSLCSYPSSSPLTGSNRGPASDDAVLRRSGPSRPPFPPH